MNKELRDPLEKVSNSLRRAVSINRSKDTDLRTTMNTIQRERRRSFNTWSLRQEKFLRAKQNLVPPLFFDQATQSECLTNSDAPQQKPRKRRITFVKAVSPVTLAAADKSSSLEDNSTFNVPNITENRKSDGQKSKNSKLQALPPVITLANSSKFFQEHKRPRRISRDHRQPKRRFTNDNTHQTFKNQEKERGKARKLSSTAVFPLDRKQQHTPSLSDGLSRANSVEADFTAEQIGKNPLPGIEERRITSSEGSYESPRINAYTEDSKLKGETSLNISKTVENESNQGAKTKWKTVRDSLQKIAKNTKTDINKFSMLELSKLFEEIRECRYLRVGSDSRSTDQTSHSRNICKCLACAIVDKNKLKNHLSAPE